MRLKDKVAIITGAGSGVGKASARLFAKEGAKVIVAEINSKSGEETVREIREAGGEATFIKVNVALPEDNQRMIQKAIDTYGRLDILFNNAGVAGEAWDKTTVENWRQVIDINLSGPFYACLYAVPVMKKQGGGVILNTASTAGIRAGSRSPVYGASKGGLVMLTRGLAKHLGKDKIRVNALCPGVVDTALSDAFLNYPRTEEERRQKKANQLNHIPLGRTAKAEEEAAAALFLVSDEASYVTGTCFTVDGGSTA